MNNNNNSPSVIAEEVIKMNKDADFWGSSIDRSLIGWFIDRISTRTTERLLNDLIRLRADIESDPVTYADQQVEALAIKREILRRTGE